MDSVYIDYYVPTVRRDALRAISDGHFDHCDTWDTLLIALCDDDSVTGGTRGSYFDDKNSAANYACQLIWDMAFEDARYETDLTSNEFLTEIVDSGPAKTDVFARQCALNECLDDIRRAWCDRRAELAEGRAISWRDLALAILALPTDLQDDKARIWMPGKHGDDRFALISSVTPFDSALPASRENFFALNLVD